MIKQSFSNLTGKILIASPYTMEGNVFHKSIIYVLQHNQKGSVGQDGSVGLIINHPLKDAPVESLFKKFDNAINLNNFNLDVHLGGPVEMERGFFLHTSDYDKDLLFDLQNSELAISSNLQIIKDMSTGVGPKKSLFIIGYTGWGAGQLEFEIENNLWIVADPSLDLIFDEDMDNKWHRALSAIGVSTQDFIPEMALC